MPRLSKKELKERDERIAKRLKAGWSIEAVAKAEGIKSPTKLKWPPESRKLGEKEVQS